MFFHGKNHRYFGYIYEGSNTLKKPPDPTRDEQSQKKQPLAMKSDFAICFQSSEEWPWI